MVVVAELERRVAGTGIFGIVVYKFNHWQEKFLVILLLVYKNSKIYFHYTVLPFSFVIGLRIESHRESLFDS